MMNVYNGNITTDKSGYATVNLPDYFNALNKDYRYQLTVIGTFANAIISQEIKDNSFIIQTDKPGVKVSWQVTGVRKDAFANAHRVKVEVEKEPEMKGKYLYPVELGTATNLSIDDVTRPKMPGDVPANKTPQKEEKSSPIQKNDETVGGALIKTESSTKK